MTAPDSSTPLEWALFYASLGWRVVPNHNAYAKGCSCKAGAECDKPGKHPRIKDWPGNATTDEEQIRKWWAGQRAASNVGIATGAGSGLIVLDVDPRNGGASSLDALERTQGTLPSTVAAITGGGGRHLLFRHPGGYVKSDSMGKVLGPGLDIKGDGGQIVAAPSTHATGRRYQWEASSMPGEVELAPAPAWLVKMLGEAGKTTTAPVPPARGATDESGAFVPPDSRHGHLLSQAGRFRNLGYPEPLIFDMLAQINAAFPEPKPREEVERIARDSSEWERKPVEFRHTDHGNAQLLVCLHAGTIRYCPKWKKWLCWDGKRWAIDDTGEIMRKARATVEALYRQAATEADGEKRKALAKWAAKSDSAAGLSAMADLARTEDGIAIQPEALDTKPWLFNVQNGTLDFECGGALRPHAPADLLTKIAPVPYLPDAPAARWERFLSEIMDGDRELIAFLRRAAGYSLTGSNREHCLFVLHGRGSNGKTTFVETVKAALGDYGKAANTDTFLSKVHDSGANNDLAGLAGSRLVAAVEADEGRRFNEALVKKVTGGDTLSARFLYGEFFALAPTFKLFLAVNDRPEVRGADDGIWRRIRLVPFGVQFTDERKDLNLPDTLRNEELPGVLRWAVDGCLDWLEVGLAPPENVTEATKDYREDMDSLADFLAAECVEAEGARVRACDLNAAYVKWCDRSGERALKQRALGTRLAQRGFEQKRTATSRWWLGLGLRTVANGADERQGA